MLLHGPGPSAALSTPLRLRRTYPDLPSAFSCTACTVGVTRYRVVGTPQSGPAIESTIVASHANQPVRAGDDTARRAACSERLRKGGEGVGWVQGTPPTFLRTTRQAAVRAWGLPPPSPAHAPLPTLLASPLAQLVFTFTAPAFQLGMNYTFRAQGANDLGWGPPSPPVTLQTLGRRVCCILNERPYIDGRGSSLAVERVCAAGADLGGVLCRTCLAAWEQALFRQQGMPVPHPAHLLTCTPTPTLIAACRPGQPTIVEVGVDGANLFVDFRPSADTGGLRELWVWVLQCAWVWWAWKRVV